MPKTKPELTPEEQVKRVETIRNFLKTSLKVTSKFHLSSWYIRRFLRARDFDIDKTKHMIKSYFDFKRRIEQKIRRENKPAGIGLG
jgi:hypothetical protein